MSKVEELIEKYSSVITWENSISDVKEELICDLEEIQAEQEELQKRIEFLEKLSELNDETIEKLQSTSKKLTNKLKEQNKPVEVPEYFDKDYKALSYLKKR